MGLFYSFFSKAWKGPSLVELGWCLDKNGGTLCTSTRRFEDDLRATVHSCPVRLDEAVFLTMQRFLGQSLTSSAFVAIADARWISIYVKNYQLNKDGRNGGSERAG